MPDRRLVIAGPPHEPNVDAARVASLLGLIPMEARQRVTYPFPDIWLVLKDEAAAAKAADELRAAGARCTVARAGDFERVPEAVLVERFDLAKGALEWWARGESGSVALDAIVAGVWYRDVQQQRGKVDSKTAKLEGKL